jgi:DNA-binding CsgD family transcriptional regulator
LADADTALIGRESEQSRLRRLVNPPPARTQQLMLLGESGMGKTALLVEAARQARSVGMRILPATGRQSEADLGVAGLHQLLRPVLDRVAALPVRQAKALLGALALSPDPVAPDALLTGLAVVTLFSLLAEDSPMLVLIDDVQWLDDASLDLLAFAARRLESERLTLLMAARGGVPPPRFERDYPLLLLEPLSRQDAARLLDAQPHPPHGRAREQVLEQAAGNPMALIELAKVIAADPTAGRRWASEPLPPTERLAAIITTRYGALPRPTQEALLLAAVADSPNVPTAALPGLTADALAPAERAGLIRVDNAGVQFGHPLVRAAIYHAVPFAERATAHLAIADTVRGQPDRHAWHLAAAVLEPDENLARLLEESAAQSRWRGGAAAAARALERAAELSPCVHDQARRLLAAAGLALVAGQADWVEDLATRVLTVTADPDLRIDAQLHIGWARVWSSRNADALVMLLSVAQEAASRQPAMAWDAVLNASTVAYQTGSPSDRDTLLTSLAKLQEPMTTPDMQASTAEGIRLWVQASTDPFGRRSDIIPVLYRIARQPPAELAHIGAAAWLLDETELAVRLLRAYVSQRGAPGRGGRSGAALSALQWACIDSGRWDEALTAAREGADAAAAYKMEAVAASADLATATVLAARGDHDQVRPLLTSALAAVDPAEVRSFAARAWHAAGIAELAVGNHLAAYGQLRQLFHTDGTPLHYHLSYLGIADLAMAAVPAYRRLEANALVGRAMAQVDSAPGPRLLQLAGRARALLAERGDAERHFRMGLADPAGRAWPFERAQLQLDYGEWLRRQRRINDAKPLLTAALDTFRRLGAAPWTRRAEAELRASGVSLPVMAAAVGALASLTAQQREIVILASRGMTNAEIADQLFLSPRTVASHLYRSYPKLGIAGRHQLRDLVDQASGPRPAAAGRGLRTAGKPASHSQKHAGSSTPISGRAVRLVRASLTRRSGSPRAPG